jgi:hypothetical protein
MESEDFKQKSALSTDKSSKYYVEDLNYELLDTPGITDGLKLIEGGITVPKFVKNLDLIKNLPLRPTDTFVIGYPKSG